MWHVLTSYPMTQVYIDQGVLGVICAAIIFFATRERKEGDYGNR